MKGLDLDFIHQGLSETNWQDIPEDQKAVMIRADCDRRIFDDFDHWMKEPRFKFKVFVAATKDDKPVGYISIGERINPAVGLPFGAILDFYVAPDFRKKGIGGKLLDYALEQIRSLGYTHSSILISSSNKRALKLYTKRGFSVDRLFLARQIQQKVENRDKMDANHEE
jgi:ribosomal protein S18 acetylase RimI-like enzyme